MNCFYTNYYPSKNTAISKKEWEDFGYESLTKLFHFLGVPIEKHIVPLVKTFKYKEYKLNDLIVEENKVSDFLYFIVSGTVRYYTVVNGVEITKSLLNEGNLATATSFMTKEVSTINIKACSKLRVLVLHQDDYLKRLHNGWAVEINTILHGMYNLGANYLHKLSTILHLQGIEKVKQLQSQFPDIYVHFSSKHISSLLGLQPATYSKLRSSSLL